MACDASPEGATGGRSKILRCNAPCRCFSNSGYWRLASIKSWGIRSIVKKMGDPLQCESPFCFSCLGHFVIDRKRFAFFKQRPPWLSRQRGGKTFGELYLLHLRLVIRLMWDESSKIADCGLDWASLDWWWCLSSEMQKIITGIVWLCRFVAIRIWVWRVQDRKLFTRGPKSTRRHESEVYGIRKSTRSPGQRLPHFFCNECFQVDLCQAFWMSRA